VSDFLAILAERSLGQVPAIRPRLPARFEPEDLRSRAPADEATGWAGGMEAGVPAQGSREPAVPPRPAAASAPHPEFSRPTPSPARGTPSAPDSPARPQVRPVATSEPVPRAIPIPRPLQRDQDEPPPHSPRTTPGASLDEPLLRPRVTSVVPPPVAIRVPVGALPAAPAPANTHQAGPVEEKPAARAALVAVRPSVQPLPAVRSMRESERREPPRLPPAEPQAPVIHVTIGRIEVRASAPQPIQKAQPVSQPPVEKLEDYLRARKDRS
jgi:hypothetical protein